MTVCHYDENGHLYQESDGTFWRLYKDGELRVSIGERPASIPPPVMVREVKRYRITVEEIQ
jgi:hypothetical protein